MQQLFGMQESAVFHDLEIKLTQMSTHQTAVIGYKSVKIVFIKKKTAENFAMEDPNPSS